MKKVIEVQRLSKSFYRKEKNQRILGSIVNLLKLKKINADYINVLRDINFDLKSGECLGIIGRNGCGKSTLLRILCGIYCFDRGSVKVRGRIVSLMNLRVGLRKRLTTKDNIFLFCAFFGMSRKEIKEKYNKIIEFSELKDFEHTKLYKFSQGMLQRLVFSISIHSDPKVLLLDEVFEVSDANFREKILQTFREKLASGMSVILVSHDLNIIKNICNRVIWLDKGKIKMNGSCKAVISSYIKK